MSYLESKYASKDGAQSQAQASFVLDLRLMFECVLYCFVCVWREGEHLLVFFSQTTFSVVKLGEAEDHGSEVERNHASYIGHRTGTR